MKINKKAFTLVELLVVVLIIGILAAIAVPYYQEAVEKSIMQEAIINLKAIAKANDVFYLQNGRYALGNEIDKLDFALTGGQATIHGANRVKTKYFIFSPGTGSQDAMRALAHRIPNENASSLYVYYLAIPPQSDNILCYFYRDGSGNNIQQKLCNQINQNGHL